MKRIEKVCMEEWKATGWDEFDEGGKDFSLWHEAFIIGARWMREEAAEGVDQFVSTKLGNAFRTIGEEEV